MRGCDSAPLGDAPAGAPAVRRAPGVAVPGNRRRRGVAVAVVERRVTIVNELGLHARPAAAFVKVAGRFKAEVTVGRDDLVVNGKSIMGVMTLAAEPGSELTIRAEGDDAQAAAEALVNLVAAGFHE
ncbi:MAG: HPr family phosphocarrier protein [Gemmatimonadetes bacterium]|nr:HPr family phosphocarrier protein [Gemmatimonadota bacterium]